MSFLLGIIYLSFISLGLPDALLGAAWPNMYPEFQVPVSYAGAISMIIAFGTIISSLQSDRLTRKFGTGKVTAVSVGMTAVALWGFLSVTALFYCAYGQFLMVLGQAIILIGIIVMLLPLGKIASLIANHISIRLLPAHLFLFLALMVYMHELLERRVDHSRI